MFIDRIVYCKGKYNQFSLVKNRIDVIIKEYQLNGFSDNINNIMELYNSVQYINELTPDDYVSVDEVSEYKKHTVTMNKMIGVAFSKINSDNFDIYANNLKPSYTKDFWYNMCSRNPHKYISFLCTMKGVVKHG